MPDPLQRRHRAKGRRVRLVRPSRPGPGEPGRAGPDGPGSGPGADGEAADCQNAAPAGGTGRAPAAALGLLRGGSLEVQGRLAVASNATLYCTVRDGAQEATCVYKPVAGERPLWDFPSGTLAGREVSAFEVSRAAGWHLVPPTVYRDGPFGPGMCQLWIDPDETVDLVALARSTDHAGLKEMAVFDAVVNNADRKIGHLLPTPDGNLYGCDHGVCFGEDYKLRTVLWQWRGRRLPGSALRALERLRQALAEGELRAELARWLSPGEVSATRRRVDMLLTRRVYPQPPEDWPAVPWPRV